MVLKKYLDSINIKAYSFSIIILAMPEQAYKRMVIQEADIDQLFNSLDTDKSGTLDINEARAFFVGKLAC